MEGAYLPFLLLTKLELGVWVLLAASVVDAKGRRQC